MEEKLLKQIISRLDDIESNISTTNSNTSMVDSRLDDLIELGKEQNNLLVRILEAIQNQ